MDYMKKMIVLMGVAMLAIILSSCTSVRKIYQGLVQKQCNKDMYIAIDLGNLEQINEALEDGANINEMEGLPFDELNPLMFSLSGYNKRITEYLIERGADVNYANEQGISPLMHTAYGTNLHLSDFLLKHGAKIDQKDKMGDTALEYAIRSRSELTIEKKIHSLITLLMDNGAKIRPITLEIALKPNSSKASLGEYTSIGDGECRYSIVKRVLEGLIEEGYKSGLEPVFEAAILGDSQRVNQLVKTQEIAEDDQKLILFYTAAFGDVETMEVFKDKGIDLESIDSNRNTLLIIASQYGNLEMVKYLLSKGVDIEARNIDKESAIFVAVKNEQYDVAQYLIKQGADIKPFPLSIGSRNVLIEAAENGDIDMLDLIIANGYPLDDENVGLAMVSAARNNQVESLKYFIDRGVDPDIEHNERTPLEDACLLGNLETVKFLVKNGASVNGTRLKGRPLKVATEYGNMDVLGYLIEKGADVNEVTVYEEGTKSSPALFSAVMNGYFDKVKLLVENGADLEYPGEDCDEKTVIIVAARWGSRNILEYLIQKGANINYQDAEGRTALMYGVISGQEDNVRVLLKYKPDLTLKDKDGLTALGIAKERKNKKMIALLEEAEKSLSDKK